MTNRLSLVPGLKVNQRNQNQKLSVMRMRSYLTCLTPHYSLVISFLSHSQHSLAISILSLAQHSPAISLLSPSQHSPVIRVAMLTSVMTRIMLEERWRGIKGGYNYWGAFLF